MTGMMHSFELFQPGSLTDAQALLKKHGDDAWLLAGDNVCQDTRCSYYRDGFPCYRAGGNTCYANTPTAMNREHTLFEAKRCVAVTPSDTAPACVVLDASMVVQRGNKQIQFQQRNSLLALILTSNA